MPVPSDQTVAFVGDRLTTTAALEAEAVLGWYGELSMSWGRARTAVPDWSSIVTTVACKTLPLVRRTGSAVRPSAAAAVVNG